METTCNGCGKSRARRSVLLLFVVGLVAMSLVVTSGKTAEAAGVVYGPNHLGSATASGITCNVSAAYGATAISGYGSETVKWQASCQASVFMNVENAADWGNLNVALSFTGNVEGQTTECSMIGTGFVLGQASGVTTATTFPCHVTAICLSWTLVQKFLPDDSGYSCSNPFDMGDPSSLSQSPDGTCSVGTFPAPTYVAHSFQNAQGWWNDVKSQLTKAVGATGAEQFHPYLVVGASTSFGVYNLSSTDLSANTLATSPGKWGSVSDSYIAGWGGSVIGVGIVRMDNPGGGVTASPTYQTYLKTPEQYAGGKVGLTDPTHCDFYWGTKITNDPNSTMDEPSGPWSTTPVGSGTDTTTTPTSPGSSSSACTFSWTDPGSWASGGICAMVGILGKVVGVLKDIASAIGHLAADIGSAILGGLGGVLTDLFVPQHPPSFADVSFTVPAGWVPSLSGFSDGACGPVSLPSLNLGSWASSTPASVLFDTCDSPWPLVRSFTYNGTLAFILLGLVQGLFRVVTTGLGMGVEGGGGDDE